MQIIGEHFWLVGGKTYGEARFCKKQKAKNRKVRDSKDDRDGEIS